MLVLLECAPARRVGELRDMAKANALAFRDPKAIDREIKAPALLGDQQVDLKGKWWGEGEEKEGG